LAVFATGLRVEADQLPTPVASLDSVSVSAWTEQRNGNVIEPIALLPLFGRTDSTTAKKEGGKEEDSKDNVCWQQKEQEEDKSSPSSRDETTQLEFENFHHHHKYIAELSSKAGFFAAKSFQSRPQSAQATLQGVLHDFKIDYDLK